MEEDDSTERVDIAVGDGEVRPGIFRIEDLKALVEIRKKGKRYVHVMVGKREDGMFYIADHEMGNYAMVSPHNMADIVWQFLEMCGIDLDDLKQFFKEQLVGRDYE